MSALRFRIYIQSLEQLNTQFTVNPARCWTGSNCPSTNFTKSLSPNMHNIGYRIEWNRIVPTGNYLEQLYYPLA